MKTRKITISSLLLTVSQAACTEEASPPSPAEDAPTEEGPMTSAGSEAGGAPFASLTKDDCLDKDPEVDLVCDERKSFEWFFLGPEIACNGLTSFNATEEVQFFTDIQDDELVVTGLRVGPPDSEPGVSLELTPPAPVALSEFPKKFTWPARLDSLFEWEGEATLTLEPAPTTENLFDGTRTVAVIEGTGGSTTELGTAHETTGVHGCFSGVMIAITP